MFAPMDTSSLTARTLRFTWKNVADKVVVHPRFWRGDQVFKCCLGYGAVNIDPLRDFKCDGENTNRDGSQLKAREPPGLIPASFYLPPIKTGLFGYGRTFWSLRRLTRDRAPAFAQRVVIDVPNDLGCAK